MAISGRYPIKNAPGLLAGRFVCGVPRLITEKFLDLVHPRLGAWVVLGRIVLARLFQFAQLFFLPFGQVDRRFDHDVAHQVTVGVTADTFDAFAAQAEDTA